MKTAVERLADAIGYPERVPGGARSYSFLADGAAIVAGESAGRLRLVFRLTDDDSLLPTLAAYAAGRMLREEAALSHGLMPEAGSRKPQADGRDRQPSTFLWQEVPADADERALVRLFESFADSCDWWRARVDEHGESVASEISEAVIRP